MRWCARTLVPALLLALVGCTPAPPVRYYALSPVAPVTPAVESELVIGVAPIALASYLDRSGVVTRTSPNALDVAAFDSWIEPLDTQARRVVARDLATLLGTDRVFVLPEQQLMPLDYVVEIAIERFDITAPAAADEAGAVALEAAAEAGETAVLEARWTLLAGNERRLLQTHPARITEAVEVPGSFEWRAAAMSEALGRLSRAIATAIAAQRRGGA